MHAYGIPGVSGVWQYLATFIAYTMIAIGMIYAGFFYLKKNPRLLSLLTQRPMNHHGSKPSLQIETMMPLENRKNLYIIQSGKERFLIATSPESTQFLSKLAEPEQTTTQSLLSASFNTQEQYTPMANATEQQEATTTVQTNGMTSPSEESRMSKAIAMHPVLSPLFQEFKTRFEKLQYQFEKTSAKRW